MITFTTIVGLVALIVSLWALYLSQESWSRTRPIVAQNPSEGQEEVSEEVVSAEVIESHLADFARNFRCNSCRKIKQQPPEFVTQIDLDMPFLDSTLPIHVYICEECIKTQ